MIDAELPANMQGVFVLSCWFQMQLADCGKAVLVAAAKATGSENAEEAAEAVATMAGGHCFMHLNYTKEAKQQWETCANNSGLDTAVFDGAGIYVKKLLKGDSDVPTLSAENVAAFNAELEKMDAVVECYAKASGEVDSAGNIDYAQINATIDSATVPKKEKAKHLKEAAKGIVTYCQNQNPASINEFYDCYSGSRPYACAALKSYALLSGGRRSCRG